MRLWKDLDDRFPKLRFSFCLPPLFFVFEKSGSENAEGLYVMWRLLGEIGSENHHRGQAFLRVVRYSWPDLIGSSLAGLTA